MTRLNCARKLSLPTTWTIFIERYLTGNMDRRASSDFRDVGLTNRRFQTLRVDQIKGHLELLYFNCPIPSSPASSTQ